MIELGEGFTRVFTRSLARRIAALMHGQAETPTIQTPASVLPPALSTSVCSVPATPVEIIERLCRLGQDLGPLWATDARLPPDVQQAVLAVARERRLFCAELAHPRRGPQGRYPAASYASPDRDEQQQAAAQIGQMLELAREHQVQRLVLQPADLPLQPSIDELAQRFARGQALPLAALLESRRPLASAAASGLRRVLERVLRRAEALRVGLAFATPAVWPHLMPGPLELQALLQEFAGAPLEVSAQVAWLRARSEIGLAATLPRRCASLHLADASGLTYPLPLGCGEVVWADVVPLAAPAVTLVLDADVQVLPEELLRGYALWQQHVGEINPA